MNSSVKNAENLLFLDIEASSLRRGSFPIEVGVAWISIVDIGSRAELIKPAPNWNRSSWSPESEAVHGISRRELASRGRPAEEVAEWLLNEIKRSDTVISDAASYDQRWLDLLLATVGAKGAVRLVDFDAFVASVGLNKLKRIYAELDQREIPHRAAADAERLAWAYVIGSDHRLLARRKERDELMQRDRALEEARGRVLRIVRELSKKRFGSDHVLTFQQHATQVDRICRVTAHGVSGEARRNIEDFAKHAIQALGCRIDFEPASDVFEANVSIEKPSNHELMAAERKFKTQG